MQRASSKALRYVNLALKNDKFSSLIYKLIRAVILKSAYLSDKKKRSRFLCVNALTLLFNFLRFSLCLLPACGGLIRCYRAAIFGHIGFQKCARKFATFYGTYNFVFARV